MTTLILFQEQPIPKEGSDGIQGHKRVSRVTKDHPDLLLPGHLPWSSGQRQLWGTSWMVGLMATASTLEACPVKMLRSPLLVPGSSPPLLSTHESSSCFARLSSPVLTLWTVLWWPTQLGFAGIMDPQDSTPSSQYLGESPAPYPPPPAPVSSGPESKTAFVPHLIHHPLPSQSWPRKL